MALILVQTDTVAPCGTILACTNPADGLAVTPQARKAEDGGAAGSGELSVTIYKADIQAGVMFESPAVGQTTWQAGTYTVRLNVTTATANLNLIEVHVCRVNSSCVSQETVGSSVGLGISMGTAGVKNVDVIGSEQSANATDRIYIVFIFQAVNHTNPIFGFTPDQNIDSPIVLAAEYTLSCDPGSYALNEQDVGLKKDSRISIGAGGYALTGQIASLLKDSKLIIGPDNYGLTGFDVDLNYIVGYTLNAEAGSFALAGQIANLEYDRIMGIEAGSYALTGQAVGVYYDRKIIAGPEAFALSGFDVGLIYGTGYTLSAEAGSYALSGQIATLLKESKIIILPSAYAIGGQEAGLLKDNVIKPVSGAYSYNGYAVNLLREAKIILDSGSFAFNGQSVELLRALKLLADPGAFIFTGFDVDLSKILVVLFAETFKVEPRHRILEVKPRERIFEVTPRVRILERKVGR